MRRPRASTPACACCRRSAGRSASGSRSRCTTRPPRCRAGWWCCATRRSRPGETDYVQLVLERPLAAAVGDRFVIRDTSSSRTVGGGILIDLRAPERRRRTPERRAEIEALAAERPVRRAGACAGGPRRMGRPRRLLPRPRHRPRRCGPPRDRACTRRPADEGRHCAAAAADLGAAARARRRGRSTPSMRSGRICRASASSSCARARNPPCRRRCFLAALQQARRGRRGDAGPHLGAPPRPPGEILRRRRSGSGR